MMSKIMQLLVSEQRKNIMYRRVIIRNNRLKRLVEIKAPSTPPKSKMMFFISIINRFCLASFAFINKA